jgi:hypothetical protein
MIYNFKQFLSESYLESGRAPIYHFARHSILESIIKDDELKTYKVSYPKDEKFICFTRDINFWIIMVI